MTSTPVTEKSNIALKVTSNVNAPSKQKEAFTDCFSQVFQHKGQEHNAVQQPETDKKSSTEKDALYTAKGNSFREQKTEVKSDSISKTDDQNAADELEEASEEIMEAVASQFGISPEQLAQAMEELDMMPADLLDDGKLKELITELTGETGQADILTDEGLFNSIRQLTQISEELKSGLQQKLGITPEELASMLQEAAERMKESGMNSEAAEELPAEMPNQAGHIGTETMEKQPVVEVHAEKNLQTEAAKGSASENSTEPMTTQETVKPENASNGSSQEEQKGKRDQQPEHSLLQQTGLQNEKANQTMVLEQTSEVFAKTTETEQIMKQIMDYMKIQIKSDMTQMEIQLHPASLGNINVQISSKEGIVTAQFTAQNEAVKTALEAQVVQLKETLNEQGVKIEAVEVTIASHEFERNLNQNQPGNEKEQESSRKSSRRVNLNLDNMGMEETESLEDADKLTADMMVRNGSTIDFSA